MQKFEGRLNILGTFEIIRAKRLPVNLPCLAVVLRLRFWPAETDLHRSALRIVAPDGEFVVPEFETRFSICPNDEDRACAYNLTMTLREIGFPVGGEHSCDFYIDGELEARLPLLISVPRQRENYCATQNRFT